MNHLLRWCSGVVVELFSVLLVTYLVLMLLETVWEGSVSRYINLNYLLIVVMVIGIVAVFSRPGKEKGAKRPVMNTGLIVGVAAGVVGAAIVWYKTREIGWLAYVLSVVSGVLIMLLSLLVWRGDEEEDERKDSKGN